MDENRPTNIRLGEQPWFLLYTNLNPRLWGITHHDENLIEINSRVRGRMELDTLIHECLHGTCPWLDEDHVEVTATEIADVLWKLGYRKQ